MTRRRISVVAVLVLVAAACGGDGAAETTTTTLSTTSTTTTTVPEATTTTAGAATTTTSVPESSGARWEPPVGPIAIEEVVAHLVGECMAGDFIACDVLFMAAPLDSAERMVGDSCGERNAPAGWCVDEHGVELPDVEGVTISCVDGDMLACDVLYVYTEVGSALEALGESCGERGSGEVSTCMAAHGLFVPLSDDEALRYFREGCEDGVFISCDMLYLLADVDSDDEAFGDTCGERHDSGSWCHELDEEALDLAAFREACADGIMLACDGLYAGSPLASDEGAFGLSCGDRRVTPADEPCIVSFRLGYGWQPFGG